MLINVIFDFNVCAEKNVGFHFQVSGACCLCFMRDHVMSRFYNH